MGKLPTAEEIKHQVASEYGCENYKHDYEYGLGISKLMDPFEFMERVCESHTAAHTAGLRDDIALYKKAILSEQEIQRSLKEKNNALRERVKELEDLFSHLVGLEAWIDDRAMREVFTNVLRKALKK